MTTINTILQGIKERADKATPGPWVHHYEEMGSENYNLMGPENKWLGELQNWNNTPGHNNASFIAHARTDIPRLLAALEKCIEQRDEMAYLVESFYPEKILGEYDAELLKILQGEGGEG